MSQRIAAVLNDEVVKRADVLVDMHCGDGNEALIPYTYWMISGDKAFDAKTRELALAFGLPHIIIDETRGNDLKELQVPRQHGHPPRASRPSRPRPASSAAPTRSRSPGTSGAS